jgi:uncharacterized protein (TIGR03086 family)
VVVEVVDALVTALEAQWALGTRVSAADLSRPTRCPGWSVSDVMSHSIGVTLKFAEFASGTTERPRTPAGDLLGDGLEPALRAAVHSARTSWSRTDMSRECHLAFGTFPAELAAGINLVDVLAHGWDVGAFGDAAFECGDEVWSVGLEMAQRFMGPERDRDHYGAEIMVPGSSPPVQRFLGYLGRA